MFVENISILYILFKNKIINLMFFSSSIGVMKPGDRLKNGGLNGGLTNNPKTIPSFQ